MALVSLVVGMGMFYIFTGGKILTYLASSANMTTKKAEGSLTMGDGASGSATQPAPLINAAPGSLGGTPSKPVEACNNGKCTVDFGDFVINGVPDNFGNFVETTGAAGTTDKLASVMDQLLKQMESGNNNLCEKNVPITDCTKEYQKLSNMVHLTADMTKFTENLAKGSPDKQSFSNKYFGKTLGDLGYTPPADLQNVFPGLATNNTPAGIFAFNNDIGFQRYNKATYGGNQPDPTTSNLGRAIVDQYDLIMNSPNYSSTLKDITKKLYSDIGDLTYNTGSIFNATSQGGSGGSCGYQYYDPVTGQKGQVIDFSVPSDLTPMLNPDMSSHVNNNGSFICSTGLHSDTGSYCK